MVKKVKFLFSKRSSKWCFIINIYAIRIKSFRYFIISNGATKPDNPFYEKLMPKYLLVESLRYDKWEIH